MQCTETNAIVDILSVTAEPSCVAVSPDSSPLCNADHAGALTVLSVAVASDPSDAVREQLISVNVSAPPELRKLEPAGV